MSISKPSIDTLIHLVEISLSQIKYNRQWQDNDLKQLRVCRHELLQEALKAEQEHYRQTHMPFSRRSRLPALKESRT